MEDRQLGKRLYAAMTAAANCPDRRAVHSSRGERVRDLHNRLQLLTDVERKPRLVSAVVREILRVRQLRIGGIKPLSARFPPHIDKGLPGAVRDPHAQAPDRHARPDLEDGGRAHAPTAPFRPAAPFRRWTSRSSSRGRGDDPRACQRWMSKFCNISSRYRCSGQLGCLSPGPLGAYAVSRNYPVRSGT